jgi:uncharacterized protein (UPF0128 family)
MESNNEEMVPLKEAEHQVKVVTQRLALLHLAYAKTLVKEFGWEKGKLLVLKAIKNYGLRVADRTQRGFQSLPKYGFAGKVGARVGRRRYWQSLLPHRRREDYGNESRREAYTYQMSTFGR